MVRVMGVVVWLMLCGELVLLVLGVDLMVYWIV